MVSPYINSLLILSSGLSSEGYLSLRCFVFVSMMSWCALASFRYRYVLPRCSNLLVFDFCIPNVIRYTPAGIEGVPDTHLCKLRVMPRSSVLRVYVLIKVLLTLLAPHSRHGDKTLGVKSRKKNGGGNGLIDLLLLGMFFSVLRTRYASI